jgi:MerR family transcriptional regulator, light-induced transcriptional regulator
MNNYSIKQLELISGIKAHTIRIWEKRYGVFSPQRTETNIRRYNEKDVQLILNIVLLTRNGFKISKVANKSSQEIAQLIRQLTTQQPSSDKNNLEPLLLSILSYNQSEFKSLLNQRIEEQGLEKTFENTLIPLLYQIGILWQTRTINSTHEHLFSNIIRQTIIFHTEQIKEPKKNSSLFLFFLPEGEYHEIGLLFYNYIAKKMGHQTSYLGQSTPVDDVVQMAKAVNPTIIFTSTSTKISKVNLLDVLKTLQKKVPHCHLFISSSIINQDRIDIPKNINVVTTLESFTKKLSALNVK